LRLARVFSSSIARDTLLPPKDGAFIVLFAHAQAEAAGAFATAAKVPAALVKEGAEIEGRMQRLCEYLFQHDPELSIRLDRAPLG
jgi:hypothetical protein